MSQVLFVVVFMEKSQNANTVKRWSVLGTSGSHLYFCADHEVLLASSVHDHKCAPKQCAAQCTAEMRVSLSEEMLLNQKQVSHIEKLKYLGVLITKVAPVWYKE